MRDGMAKQAARNPEAMHILNVSALLDPVIGGGTAERTVQLSRAFSLHGWQTTCLCVDTGFDRPALQRRLGGARLELLPCFNRRFLLPIWNRARMDKLIESADIIHLSNHWTVLNALVVRSAIRQRKPWIVCPAGALPLMGRSQGIKRVYNRFAGTRLIREAAAWVAITHRESTSFEDYGVAAHSVSVIPNGIEPSEYMDADADEFRRRHGLGDRSLLTFLGRLNPIKGPDLLLAAFQKIADRHPSWDLLFAGPDGGMLHSLRSQASLLGERVKFLGHVGLSEKSSLLTASNLVAVPSRSEAMSLVALEAGACATPVLMTTECGFDDLPDSGGGELVGANAIEIAAGLDRMLSQPERLAAQGEHLREYIFGHYVWKSAVSRYESLFASILSEWRAK